MAAGGGGRGGAVRDATDGLIGTSFERIGRDIGQHRSLTSDHRDFH